MFYCDSLIVKYMFLKHSNRNYLPIFLIHNFNNIISLDRKEVLSSAIVLF